MPQYRRGRRGSEAKARPLTGKRPLRGLLTGVARSSGPLGGFLSLFSVRRPSPDGHDDRLSVASTSTPAGSFEVGDVHGGPASRPDGDPRTHARDGGGGAFHRDGELLRWEWTVPGTVTDHDDGTQRRPSPALTAWKSACNVTAHG